MTAFVVAGQQTRCSHQGSSCHGFSRQIPDPDEVVNRRREGEHPFDAAYATMTGLPHQTHGLQPPEDLFDPLALFLTLGVSGVSRRTAVDRARALGGVLGHVRRHVEMTQVSDEVPRVIGLVTAQRDAVLAGNGKTCPR